MMQVQQHSTTWYSIIYTQPKGRKLAQKGQISFILLHLRKAFWYNFRGVGTHGPMGPPCFCIIRKRGKPDHYGFYNKLAPKTLLISRRPYKCTLIKVLLNRFHSSFYICQGFFVQFQGHQNPQANGPSLILYHQKKRETPIIMWFFYKLALKNYLHPDTPTIVL